MTGDKDTDKTDEGARKTRRRGEHNEIGYRNVDEQAEHDEAGSQGPGPEEPAREQ